MRLEDIQYTSYKTHNYCSICVKWYLGKENLRCPKCNQKLRLNPRGRKLKEARWEKAY